MKEEPRDYDHHGGRRKRKASEAGLEPPGTSNGHKLKLEGGRDEEDHQAGAGGGANANDEDEFDDLDDYDGNYDDDDEYKDPYDDDREDGEAYY